MKKIFISILLLSSFLVKADFVDENTAEIVAKNYLINVLNNSRYIQLELAHTEYLYDKAIFYVFDIEDDFSYSHIIIAADDRYDPIRAYIPSGRYNPETRDFPGIKWWINNAKLFYIDSIVVHQTNRKLRKWDFLINDLPLKNNISFIKYKYVNSISGHVSRALKVKITKYF